MSFHRGTWIKATRKPHRCWWCGQKIEVGAAAYYASGINYESDFWCGHSHPECQAAMDVSDDYGEGFGEHEHARGRTDDDRDAPPEFSPDYRGKSLGGGGGSSSKPPAAEKESNDVRSATGSASETVR